MARKQALVLFLEAHEPANDGGQADPLLPRYSGDKPHGNGIHLRTHTAPGDVEALSTVRHATGCLSPPPLLLTVLTKDERF